VVFGLWHRLALNVGDKRKNQAEHFGYTVRLLSIHGIWFWLGNGA